MKMLKLNKTFVEDESGAVTVDWVVLTAAIVGIGLVVLSIIRTSVNAASSNIAKDLLKASTANRP